MASSPSESPSSSPSESPSASESPSPSESPSTSPSSSPSASPSPGGYSDITGTGVGVQARGGLALLSKTGSFAFTDVLVANDVIDMVKVPAGATVIEVILAVPALDSATTVTISVGYGDTATLAKFISASTIGQSVTSGVARTSVAGGTGVLFSTETAIRLWVVTGPSTVSSGTITLTV